MKEKLKKICKFIINDIKVYYKSYIIFLIVLLTFLIRFDYYIYSPGGLLPLEDRIEIENSYESEGSFNMTYVSAKNGILPFILLSYIIPSWDLVSVDESRIENESSDEIILRNQIELKATSYDAIIAAFNEAKKPYEIKSTDVTVLYVYEEADTNIVVGDVIKSINGEVVDNFDSVKGIINSYNENDRININVSRDGKIVECYAVLMKENDNIIIGLHLSEIKDIDTTPKVDYIFKNSESGSSRGLMCALEIYNRITEYDLTKGDVIAGTGIIYSDGTVGDIAGIKYKLSGAVRKKADVFIVPTANYEEALKIKKENNYDIELIEADNLHNVIEKLMNR